MQRGNVEAPGRFQPQAYVMPQGYSMPQGYAAQPPGYSSQPQGYFSSQPTFLAQHAQGQQQQQLFSQPQLLAAGYSPSGPAQSAPSDALEALRAEFTRAVQLVRVDSGEVLLSCELLGDPRNNDQVEFRARVEFAAPFVATPVVRLAISSLYADGSGDHGTLPNINGDLDRLLCMLTALDVSERGFTLRVATWHRGHLRPNSRFLWFASASPAWAAAPPDLGAAAAPAARREAADAAKQCAIV